MYFPKPRKRHESTLDYTKGEEENSKILLKEKIDLLHWTDTVEIQTPNLFIPAQIAQHIGSLPYCKLAVSPKADYLAVMNHSRLLNVYSILGETVSLESSVQVLEDAFAEYCLLEYSSSGSLLLSTRSCAQVDVFDHTGGYCYDIPLETPDRNLDLMSAVSCIRTVSNSSDENDKFSDLLYVLQFNGQFSVFKVGRLSRYHMLWSVSLDIGLTGSFTLSVDDNVLFVASNYKNTKGVRSTGGMCSFRLIDSEPYVAPLKVPEINGGGWLSRLPFSSSSYAYLCSLSLSKTSIGSKLVAVSTSGDFFLYDVPSTDIAVYIEYISGPMPVQAVFVDEDELCVLFNNGSIIRSSVLEIREAMHRMETSDLFSQRSYLSVPCLRELFVLSGESGSRALKEVASQRTSLAFRLWFYTLWQSFKQLVGMAVGDAAVPLQMATHSEDLTFSVHHCPTRTLQELFEQTLNEKNYERAKVLASTYDTIDADVILKREWRDICASSDVTIEDVNSILGDISDKEWVADATLTCDAPSLEVQKALIDLCSDCVNDLPRSHTLLLFHCQRVLEICDDVSLYLELREKALLDIAFELAKRCVFGGLEKLFSRNFSVLSSYLLEILDEIPTCVPLSRYKHLCPDRYGNLRLSIDEDRKSNILRDIISSDSELEQMLGSINIGSAEGRVVSQRNTLQWIRQRCQRTDEECGIPTHVVALLKFGLELGYNELRDDFNVWHQFTEYISMCTLVNESYEMFSGCTMDHIINSVIKLTQSELVSNCERILKLLIWRSQTNGDIHDALSTLLKEATLKGKNSVEVLVKFRNQNLDLVEKNMVIDVLCESSVTGENLLNALRSLDVCPEVASAVKALADRGVRPGFGRLWESLRDKRLATGVLKQMASCGQAETAAEWEMLRDEVIQLAEGIYSSLLPREEVIEIVAGCILLDNSAGVDLQIMKQILTLDISGSVECDGHRLGSKKSAELLLRFSNELMQDAVTRGDEKLSRSKFLAEVAKEINTRGAVEQLKFLEIIDLIHELGSPMLPAVVKFTDPSDLLSEVVNIGDNYKQGKKCARLAVLLGIPTPVATALSVCSLAAIKAGDQKCLKTYISEVINKSKGGIHVVHKLCKEIMKINVFPLIMDDIYCCALLNSPVEELEETFELIRMSKENMRDQCNIDSIQINQGLVHDPYYTKIEFLKNEPIMTEEVAIALNNVPADVTLASLARLLSYHSATAALCTAMAHSDEVEWTNNDQLQRYEHAMRFFHDKLTPNLVSAVPPLALINAASTMDDNISPLDRLSSYGVDRERFIEDVVYRKETIIGLAMDEQEVMFTDALSLAKDFKMDEWDVHMASLENALTSLSIPEAKTIIKTRGHLKTLRNKPAQFHDALRHRVFPLLDTNEKFIAYLTLFNESEPEKNALPSLKKLLEKKKDLDGKRLFSQVDYLSGVILTMPDKTIIMLAEDLHRIPVGTAACEDAASVLLEGTNIRPPASSLMVFYFLLNKDELAVLELVSTKSLVGEIQYLRTHLEILEALPQVDATLKDAVRERIQLLTSNDAPLPSPVPSNESQLISRRKH